MNGRILVVEDDPSLSELVRDYLEAEGFQAEGVEDGTAGLRRALEEDWDLILLDLMLPGTGGFEILKILRGQKDTPVLLVSARSEDIDKIRGLGLGADDYVGKPFSPSELMARVKAHLNRYRRLTGRKAGGAPLLTLGPLTLDPVNRSLQVRGAGVELTAKEMELIQLFMNHPGRLFTKEELYGRVWGEETAGDQSTVTVHIRKLREKLEADPSEPELIQTVWGLGYRLKAVRPEK